MPIRSGKEEKGLRHLFFMLIAVLILIVDQWSKSLVCGYLASSGSKTLISGFFDLTLVYNTGSAFGTFKGATHYIILISIFSVILILFLYFSFIKKSIIYSISLALVLGGAIGNLIDRVVKGHVVDYLDFYVRQYHWPAFNVADSAITIGMILLAYQLFFDRKERTK